MLWLSHDKTWKNQGIPEVQEAAVFSCVPSGMWLQSPRLQWRCLVKRWTDKLFFFCIEIQSLAQTINQRKKKPNINQIYEVKTAMTVVGPLGQPPIYVLASKTPSESLSRPFFFLISNLVRVYLRMICLL